MTGVGPVSPMERKWSLVGLVREKAGGGPTLLTKKPGDAVKMVAHRSSVAGRRRRTWCR